MAVSTSSLRRFGLTVGGALATLGVVSWLRGHATPPVVLWALGAALTVPALVAPRLLAPVERVWMRVAARLGEINARVILTLFFYAVIAPVGLVLRRFRDPLDRSLDDQRATQWIKRPRGEVDPKGYERQF